MNLEEKIEKLAQFEKEAWSECVTALLVELGIHRNSSYEYIRYTWHEIDTHYLNMTDDEKAPYREWARKIIDLLENS